MLVLNVYMTMTVDSATSTTPGVAAGISVVVILLVVVAVVMVVRFLNKIKSKHIMTGIILGQYATFEFWYRGVNSRVWILLDVYLVPRHSNYDF